jgi:crotonobetainyl-CoA:carnitine CoA-transferase CaiB-like acyl-CoA transferase
MTVWPAGDSARAPASAALARFKVLDLTRVRAGPTCARQLADWGADVIKIEMPAEAGSDGGPGGPRAGSDFQNLHRNKRSMILNLKNPDGLGIFMTLARQADVVVENYRPDVKDRLGIGYEALAAINPGIVLASISGFGQHGPYRERPGFDQIAQGMGGLMSITGLPGQGPVRAGIPIADLTAGLLAAQGVLMALLERQISGRGQWVQSSLLQAQVFMLDFQAARWLVDGEVPGQAGNDHPTSIPTGVFATADGHINVAASGQTIWRRFCTAIGAPELLDDPDFATGAERSANRARLNGLLGAQLRERTSAEWIELLNGVGVPSGPINRIDQVFADPQVAHLAMAWPVTSTERGPTRLVGQGIEMSRTPAAITAPPPLAGEHTEAILAELGHDQAAIARLRSEGAI